MRYRIWEHRGQGRYELKHYVCVEDLVNHFRFETRAEKYAKALEKYAEKHAVDAVAVGDPLDEYIIEVYRDEAGRSRARLAKYTGEIREKCSD